jgi:hypothetical protein
MDCARLDFSDFHYVYYVGVGAGIFIKNSVFIEFTNRPIFDKILPSWRN